MRIRPFDRASSPASSDWAIRFIVDANRSRTAASRSRSERSSSSSCFESGVELDRRRHAVGVEVLEVVGGRPLVGHLLDEVGVALVRLGRQLELGRLGLGVVVIVSDVVVEHLDLAGRVGHVVDPPHQP